jgi:hypothetical protein
MAWQPPPIAGDTEVDQLHDHARVRQPAAMTAGRRRPAGAVAPARRPSGWAGYAAAGWALVFAVRGVYWALGGTAGLGTLSRGIQQAAAARDRSLLAALWVTVLLEVAGALLALALVRPGPRAPRWLPLLGGRRVPGWLLLAPAWGAGTLLAGHGVLFVSPGVLAALRRSPARGMGVAASVLGALGGLAVAGAPLVVSAIV